MLVPLLLICGAIGSASLVAYGTSAELAQYRHGIQIIVLSRRLEWPMVALSLLLCTALLAITISGRRRIWWLLGLSPVLALFLRAFSSVYHAPVAVLETPQFVSVEPGGAASLAEEYVVGLIFEGKPYAMPYSVLADSPLVLISAFDSRALVIWSMTANRAVVLPLDRDARPRDLEVVSRPADSLLLFNSRLGQFIVGVTGQTVKGEKPLGFGSPLASEKMPAPLWIQAHPDTLLLRPEIGSPRGAKAPALPSLQFRAGGVGPRGDSRIAMFATTEPTAILSDVLLDHPVNTQAGQTRILLERDPQSGSIRAFDRHLNEDLFLTLNRVTHAVRKHPEIALVDSESASFWTIDGHAVAGPLKGQRLREIAIDDGLYWGVMKFWIPGLKLIQLN